MNKDQDARCITCPYAVWTEVGRIVCDPPMGECPLERREENVA